MDGWTVARQMEWMEMDARTVHSTGWTKWTVDVEWIAILIPCRLSITLGGLQRPRASGGVRVSQAIRVSPLECAESVEPLGKPEHGELVEYLD